MAAAETVTTRGSQGGSRPRVPAGTGNPEISGSTAWAADRTDATFRQIDYWARAGWLGDHHQGLGSGRRRHFTDADLEVVVALRQVASLGATERWLQHTAEAVRAERVRPGEWLLVTIAGHTLRCSPADLPRVVTRGDDHQAAWLIRLEAFDNGRPLSLARPEGGGRGRG